DDPPHPAPRGAPRRARRGRLVGTGRGPGACRVLSTAPQRSTCRPRTPGCRSAFGSPAPPRPPRGRDAVHRVAPSTAGPGPRVGCPVPDRSPDGTKEVSRDGLLAGTSTRPGGPSEGLMSSLPVNSRGVSRLGGAAVLWWG